MVIYKVGQKKTQVNKIFKEEKIFMDITTMYSAYPECSNIKEIDFQDLVKAFLSSIDVSDSTRTRYTSYLT